MTNREAFDLFLRQEMEEKLKALEEVDNAQLVDMPGNLRVSLMVHNMLCLYKCNSTGKSIGNAASVVDWLKAERTEEEEKRWLSSVEWNNQRVKQTSKSDEGSAF